MKNNTKKYAFTLIEILVAMAICSIIILIFNQFLITGFKSTTFNMEQEEAISEARNGLDVITKEIRGANSSENGSYAISEISTNTFAFYNDINKDGRREKIKYYLDGYDLKKVVTLSGEDNNYTSTSTTSVLSKYINNRGVSIFKYYDNSNTETLLIDRIKRISIELYVNVTPQRAPDDYILETDVTFRNLINL